MAGRRLDLEERALWQRVTADVRPIRPVSVQKEPIVATPASTAKAKSGRSPTPAPLPAADIRRKAIAPAAAAANTLDGGWDRRLRRGAIIPDIAIDLHGHTLASAHAELDAGIAQALADEARVLLLVTGKPPRGDAKGRGAIRAAVPDWLHHSRHSRHIAAVRNAHPRHGGQGALYVILRRAARRE
ncbi:Smr/MutS family protein [Sphingomonas sp. 1P06PA]|uniref:Smr/MutS family protein n=1 Tax=Sphingomonas sp. 1P06PA TaxID=554121 RepID=UPI0039A46EC3